MKTCFILVSLIGLAFGAAVDVHEEEADKDSRAIVLPGSPLNCASQWLTAGNPCANNPLNKLNFPHPTDKTKFLQCGTYNRLYIVQCPTGEVYDQATTACIQPSLIIQPPVQNIGTTGLGNPCTAQAIATGKLYFSVASDNRKFIHCDQYGNGQIMTCPSQLIWDESRLSCVYTLTAGTILSPGALGTGAGTLNGALTNGNPCTAQAITQQALFFSHPDPTKFIQCDLQGNAFVQNCPAGLVWNQYLETCASQVTALTGQLVNNGGYVVSANGQVLG